MGQEKTESIMESFARLGRLKKMAEGTDEKKKGGGLIEGIQGFAAKEAARKKKEAEDAAKKKITPIATAPEDGFLTRMYKKYVGGGDKK